MDPINYNLHVQSPFESALQGYQAGAGIRNDQIQAQQQQLALQQQQGQMQVLGSLMSNPNPTADDYSNAMTMLPGIADKLQAAWSVRNTQRQQNDLLHMGQVYSALSSGQPNVAKSLLQNRADALQASGRTDDAQHAQAMASLLDQGDAGANTVKAMTGLGLAAIPGGKEMIDGARNISMMPADQQKAEADADSATAGATVKQAEAANAPYKLMLENKNTLGQINERAGRLKLDQDKLTTDTQLKLKELDMQYGLPDGDTRKEINSAAVAAASSEQSAARLNDLADRVEQANTGYGLGGKASDIFARATGSENGTQALKQEIARQVNNTAVGQLREQLGGGGRFTDTDMNVALGHVPDENSNPSLIASYFRGMAKLQTLQAAQQNAQAEWLSQVKHLGKSTKDITIMGTTVPAGSTFADFSRQFIQQKAAQLSAQSNAPANVVQGRSYMRFAMPAGGATPKPGQIGSGTFGVPGVQ